MSLRLSKDASTFFATVDELAVKGVSFLDMDKFFACLALGLRAGEIDDKTELNQPFLAAGAKFPSIYEEYDSYILGMLIQAEITRRKLDPNDRDRIEKLAVDLLDPRSSLGLSVKGIELLNQYAAGGLAILRDAAAPPRSIDSFLVDYAQLWVETTSA